MLLVVPAMASEQSYSYPFTPTGYAIAQLTFALQHIALVIGVVGLIGLVGTSRITRNGVAVAAGGLVLLTAMELFAITAANSAVDDPRAALVNSLYGLPTVLIGLALVVGGTGVVRAGTWTGWQRWITLVLGVYVFVVLLPAIFAPYVAGRIAIGVWMLLFAALGVAMTGVRVRQ